MTKIVLFRETTLQAILDRLDPGDDAAVNGPQSQFMAALARATTRITAADAYDFGTGNAKILQYLDPATGQQVGQEGENGGGTGSTESGLIETEYAEVDVLNPLAVPYWIGDTIGLIREQASGHWIIHKCGCATCCCDGCDRKIASLVIKLDFEAGGSSTHTLPIGASMREKCYIPLKIGCTGRYVSRYVRNSYGTCELSHNERIRSVQIALSFPNAGPDADDVVHYAGVLSFLDCTPVAVGAMLQTSITGAYQQTQSYTWDDERYITSDLLVRYKGTTFTLHLMPPGNNCPTDAEMADYIRTQLEAINSPSTKYPELVDIEVTVTTEEIEDDCEPIQTTTSVVDCDSLGSPLSDQSLSVTAEVLGLFFELTVDGSRVLLSGQMLLRSTTISNVGTQVSVSRPLLFDNVMIGECCIGEPFILLANEIPAYGVFNSGSHRGCATVPGSSPISATCWKIGSNAGTCECPTFDSVRSLPHVTAKIVWQTDPVSCIVDVPKLPTTAIQQATITYSLTNDGDGAFEIDSTTGVVTVSDTIDRESNSELPLIIKATSSSGASVTRAFVVKVGDVNEFSVANMHDLDPVENSVYENSQNGIYTGVTAAAVDEDATDNAITYSLDDNGGGRFAINPKSGIVTVANGSLLNHNSNASHTITMRATSEDGSSATMQATITIKAGPAPFSIVIRDNDSDANEVAEPGETTVGVTAIATDTTPGATVTYSLPSDRNEAPRDKFSIDSSSGVLSVDTIDAESIQEIDVTIKATSSSGLVAYLTVIVRILDVNEFEVRIPKDIDTISNTVPSFALDGTPVGIIVNAIDLDATNTVVTYSLEDDAGGRFAIDATTGLVTVADGAALDYCADRYHQITVRGTSSDGSSRLADFTIEVLDRYHLNAIADNDTADDSVDENSGVGTTIGIAAKSKEDLIPVAAPLQIETITIDIGGWKTILSGRTAESIEDALSPLGSWPPSDAHRIIRPTQQLFGQYRKITDAYNFAVRWDFSLIDDKPRTQHWIADVSPSQSYCLWDGSGPPIRVNWTQAVVKEWASSVTWPGSGNWGTVGTNYLRVAQAFLIESITLELEFCNKWTAHLSVYARHGSFNLPTSELEGTVINTAGTTVCWSHANDARTALLVLGGGASFGALQIATKSFELETIDDLATEHVLSSITWPTGWRTNYGDADPTATTTVKLTIEQGT